MGKIPTELRDTIARNIRACRLKMYPGRGGGKKCAEAFGVSPQQWSPWERGFRTPDELHLERIAAYFGKTVEYMRRDNRLPAPGGQADDSPNSPLAWAVWSLGPRADPTMPQNYRAPLAASTWYEKTGDLGVIGRYKVRDGATWSTLR